MAQDGELKDTKITPVRYSRNDRQHSPSDTKRSFYAWAASITAALLVLIGGGFYLLRILSHQPPEAPEATVATVEEDTKTPNSQDSTSKHSEIEANYSIDSDHLEVKKKQAEELFEDFTLARNELLGKGVLEWGGTLHAQMERLGREADTALMEKEYLAAQEKYLSAIAVARELAGQTQQAYTHALAKGQTALQEGDGQGAEQQFRIALMIDPTSELAQNGLERARVTEEVMQLLLSGKAHEEKGDDAFAYADYQEALRRDPQSNKAQLALNRVRDRIKNESFHQLMSEGLAAYHKNDYGQAKKKLLKARSLEPASHEVQSALEQVDQAILLSRIKTLESKALKAEKEEQWDEALQSYQEVLKIDPTIQFAVRGKERANQQIGFDQRIAFFLRDPDTLGSDLQLENAKDLIRDLEGLSTKGARRTSDLAALKRIVSAAQIPVEMTIESDNQTEVAVYKVGKLGRFSRRTLILRQGTYTVVGARDGYQDVRHQVVIAPGQQPFSISVICNVKL